MENSEKIRVLVVDDSEFKRNLIMGILETDPRIKVVGQAKDGEESVRKTHELSPAVITMDIQMPVMDGLAAIKKIMAEKPTPILVISATVSNELQFAFNCLKYGALDFVAIDPDSGIAAKDLISKIKICSRINVVTHLAEKEPVFTDIPHLKTGKYKIIGIAVSTGGPAVLQKILSLLPRDFPLPILIVQHISEGFMESLCYWLGSQVKIKVAEANDGEVLNHGTAYFAPCGFHITIDKDRKVKLFKEDIPKYFNKPSADVMLKSLAAIFGSEVIGVILTGMGRDGAEGVRAIKEAGGFTIAQNEASSLIYGMNKVAIEAGSVVEVLSIDQIAQRLIKLVIQ